MSFDLCTQLLHSRYFPIEPAYSVLARTTGAVLATNPQQLYGHSDLDAPADSRQLLDTRCQVYASIESRLATTHDKLENCQHWVHGYW